MKQYDKIYVPDRNGDFKLQEFEEDYHEWRDVHSEEALSPKENVIVLPLEELIGVWNAGAGRMEEIMKNIHANCPDKDVSLPKLSDYLQSKGITI